MLDGVAPMPMQIMKYMENLTKVVRHTSCLAGLDGIEEATLEQERQAMGFHAALQDDEDY